MQIISFNKFHPNAGQNASVIIGEILDFSASAPGRNRQKKKLRITTKAVSTVNFEI